MKSLSSLFSRASLKNKLMMVTMITTLITLAMICAAFIAYDIYNVKKNAVQEMNLLADIIAKRTAPALEFFGDAEQVEKNLADLANKDEVVLACVYSSNFKVLAKYENLNDRECPQHPGIGSFFESKHLSVDRDIISVSGNNVGNIYILSDLREVRAHFLYAISGAFGVSLIIFVIVYLISSQSSKIVARPIAELAMTASRIANEKNYDLMAKKIYDDEIGHLTTIFNRMVLKVRDYNKDMEQLVEARTEELYQSLKETEQALNKAEKADKHKSEWIRNMSHEFRTPVHGILSFAKFGVNDAENETIPRVELHTYFRRILQSTERLQYLVNGILDIAATESGKITLIKDDSNLKVLAEDVVKQLSGVLKDNSLKVNVENPDFQPVANIDAQRVTQVITNLMGNAIKFSPDGSEITISFEKDQVKKRGVKMTDAVKFSICDQGCGVPEDELSEIFDTFKQSSATNDQSGGTGLGLSISLNIIKAHGGRIWAENNPDGGANFSFVVPVS